MGKASSVLGGWRGEKHLLAQPSPWDWEEQRRLSCQPAPSPGWGLVCSAGICGISPGTGNRLMKMGPSKIHSYPHPTSTSVLVITQLFQSTAITHPNGPSPSPSQSHRPEEKLPRSPHSCPSMPHLGVCLEIPRAKV